MYSIMTRFTTIPLILLLIPATQASLLRASHERDLLSMNLGCPYKECYPISYFSLDALETATCQDSSDCEYGFPCVYYEGRFQCGNHVSNPCSLDCVSGQAQREGDAAPTLSPVVVCQDVKTCFALTDLLAQYPTLTGACRSTEDCPNGQCRFLNATKVLQCDDSQGTYCDNPCVEDSASTTRGNVAFGGGSNAVLPCSGIRLCESLSTILNSVTNNPNLLGGGECASTEDCGDGAECRYDVDSDELKCDDSFGTYCDYECVENDLQAAVNIAG